MQVKWTAFAEKKAFLDGLKHLLRIISILKSQQSMIYNFEDFIAIKL